jgi:lipoprotein-anchoring transpeptidase ErfK/SrfK
MRRALAPAVAALLLAPAAASAQDPAPAPAPPPPAPAITLAAVNAHPAGHDLYVLSGHSYRINGTMTPVAAVPQQVELRIHRNGKKIRTVRAAVRPDGTFTRRMPTRRTGRFAVRAVHVATPELAAARGPKVAVNVVRPRASEGMRGPLVRLLQRGLAKLRYAVPRTDNYDSATARAVMAYRKVNKLARRYDADRRVIERVLAGRGAFKVRHPNAGRHVEADISRQVLALIEGERVVATYHTSTGAPATPTIIGSFRVYRKDPGTNALGMVHSSYFIRGYAIHGYVDVPAFNASHGCLRVPIPDAWRIFQWLRHGDRVITYP